MTGRRAHAHYNDRTKGGNRHVPPGIGNKYLYKYEVFMLLKQQYYVERERYNERGNQVGGPWFLFRNIRKTS